MLIPVGLPASGLDIFLRFQGVLTDPLSISYDIIEPALTTVASGVGFKRSTGHYDARNSVIPSGFSISEAWTITWTFTSPVGVTSSLSENFTVVAALVPSFDNLTNIKNDIKTDLGITTEFTDTELTTFIQKALNRLNRRLNYVGTSQELSFDSGLGVILPTPSTALLDLITLQSECLIASRSRVSAVAKGIRVRDGDSEIDTTASFGGHNAIVRELCEELTLGINQFLYNQAGVAQHAKVSWYGNRRIEADMDHDGQGTGRTRDFTSPFDGDDGFSASFAR